VAAWLKTHPRERAALERLTFDAEALWHIVRLYCAAVGNNGILARADLHVAVARKIGAARARRLAVELVDAGLWRDDGDNYEVVDWLRDQPLAEVWDDDTKRERWTRDKALKRDRRLCNDVKARDHNRCRYCGIRVDWLNRKGAGGGTYDHVDPDSDNRLTNVVVACRRCNGRKKNRTPDQAGMVLLRPGTTDEDLAAGSSPDPAPVKPESDRRPDTTGLARETGPNQTGTEPDQTATAQTDEPPHPTPLELVDEANQLEHTGQPPDEVHGG